MLQRHDHLIAIEVKSNKIHRATGIDSFVKQFKPSSTLLVGEDGIPWEEFLEFSPSTFF